MATSFGLTFLSNDVKVNNEYKLILYEPYVDYLLETSPAQRIKDWIDSNIKGFGVERKLVIIIKKASITESYIESEEKIVGIVKKNKEIKYNLEYLATFNIYDDYDNLLAYTEVKSKRSTTSSSSISLYEKEKILNDLVYKSLKDFTLKSQELSKKYLNEYIL